MDDNKGFTKENDDIVKKKIRQRKRMFANSIKETRKYLAFCKVDSFISPSTAFNKAKRSSRAIVTYSRFYLTKVLDIHQLFNMNDDDWLSLFNAVLKAMDKDLASSVTK